MPRVYLTQQEEIKSGQLRQFKSALSAHGIDSMTAAGQIIGLSQQSMSRRCKDKMLNLSLYELSKIAKGAKFTDEEIVKVVKGRG